LSGLSLFPAGQLTSDLASAKREQSHTAGLEPKHQCLERRCTFRSIADLPDKPILHGTMSAELMIFVVALLAFGWLWHDRPARER
jgi:hypothetical protein